MTREGREYRRRKQEDSDEETDRRVCETIDEMKRELENRETPEKRELPEQTYCPDVTVREVIKEIQEEEAERMKLREQREQESEKEETKKKVKEIPQDWDVERCVRETIQEIEIEKERLREEREKAEMEKEQQREASREARKETAEKDNLEDYEEKIKRGFEKHGIDPEEVKERWRKKFEEEVKRELGEERESKKVTEGKEEESAGQERTADGCYYYDDGSGQVYEVKDSKESSSTKVETNTEVQEKGENPQPEVQEDSEVKKESKEPESREQSPKPVREKAVQEFPKEQETPERKDTSKTETEEEVSIEQEVSKPEKTAKTEVEKEGTEKQEQAIDEKPQQDNRKRRAESTSESEQEPSSTESRERTKAEKESVESEKDSEEVKESREEQIWNEYETKNRSLEDENYKQYLRETQNAIPEEDQERFKKLVREQARDIDEFKELALRHGLDELLEEEEIMEEIRKYLELRKALENDPDANIERLGEELEIDVELAEEWSRGESEPTSLKKLLNLEAYYLWDEILRNYREQGIPQSQEELEKAMEENQRLRTDRFFKLEYGDAVAWIEIMSMRRKGEIRKRIRNGREVYERKQIERLSKKYGISKRDIIQWLRGEKVPSLIRNIDSKKQTSRHQNIEKTKSGTQERSRVVSIDIQQHLNLNNEKKHPINKEFHQSHNLTGKGKNTRYYVIDEEGIDEPNPREVKEVSEKPWRIQSEEDLEKALEHHIDLMARKDFDQRHGEAITYFRFENSKGIELPDLVRELENRELKRLYEVVHGNPPEIKIESMDDVDELVEKHPSESKRTDFKERRNFSELYLQIKDDYSLKRDEIAKVYGVSKGFVTKAWNGIEPAQINQLRKLEENRIVREWAENIPIIPKSALDEFKEPIQFNRTWTNEFVQKIEDQVIQDILAPLRDAKEPAKEDIISVVEQMVRNISDETKRFFHADLDSELSRRKIKQVERCLRTNKAEIEESLSKTLGLDHVRARIAVVENRVYLWIPKHRPDELVQAYESQFYYFRNRKEVIRIIDELRRNLGVEGNLRKELSYVSEIVRQLIEYKGGNSARKKPLDIHSTRIEGKIIRMYLDATGKNLSDIEGTIVKIAGVSGRAGIENPRFPEGEKLEVLVARLVSTVASDCHLMSTGRILYNEAHLGRIARVQDTVSEFGAIELEPKYRKGKYDIHIPCQIGLILIEEGMTPGNKTINNPGLPEGFMDWSDTAKRAYLEDLIPEDGSFSGGRFKWYRSHAIYINKHKENYEFKSEIGVAEVELLKNRGTPQRGLVPKSHLPIKSLEKLQDDNPAILEAAKTLAKVASESTNNLITDEKRLAESLGFVIDLNPRGVSYYPRTGRVSVRWVATTDSLDDTIKWGIECPPNDVRKKQAVETWLRKIAENWMDKRPLRNW